MKTLLTLFSTAFTLLSIAQTGIIWEPEVTVADGSTYGKLRPRIAVDGNNNPHIVFGQSSTNKLFTVSGNGTSFNAPIDILPNGTTAYVANWTGPDIVAYNDTVTIVYKLNPMLEGNIYAVRSTDGGLSYSDTIRVDNYDIGQTWMPAMDIDDNGNPVVTYMIFNAAGSDERIAVCSSNDGGLTYQPQQNVTANANGVACDCCPPEMLASNQHQIALFRNNETNIRDAHGAHSLDGGANFDYVDDLDELNWYITSCPTTGPHGVILGDTLFTALASRASGVYRVYVSKSSLSSGLTFESIEMMNPPTSHSSDAQNYPRISGSNDTIVMAWEEKEMLITNVLCAVTTTSSMNELTSNKYIVNASTEGFQSKPDIVYKNGFVHIVYQDYNSGNLIYRRGTIGSVANTNVIATTAFNILENPFRDNIIIESDYIDQVKSISLYHTSGQEIAFNQISNEAQLKLTFESQLSDGIYLLNISLQNGQEISKQIVLKK